MAKQDDTTEWTDRQGAAAYLMVSPRTVDRYVDDGRLRAYRLGTRQVRIRTADLRALVEAEPIPARTRRR